MVKYEKLIDLFSDAKYEANHLSARSTNTCILCGKPAKSFRDSSARLEYNISALCQDCQDRLFNRD